MSRLYKASEWQIGSRWYVNDTTSLTSSAALWYTPVRFLQMSFEDYILMLKDQFHASHFYYTAKTNVLVFSFDSQADARKYKNWINKKAREGKWLIYD